MSAVPRKTKRDRQPVSQAPARHSGEERVTQIGQWESTTTGELCEFITSGSRDWKSYYSDSGAYFIRTQDINRDHLDLSNAARVKLPDRVEGKRSRVLPGDLLITITGANVGKVALVPDQIDEAYVSQSVGLMRLRDKRYAPYLHHYLQSEECGRKQVLGLVYGIGRPVLSLQNLRDIPVVLPPLEAQRKIIAEIEKQSTRLDSGVAALRRVQANLKRYRAAVLKAACEGRLVATEAELARAEGRTYETGEQLLARILADRRKNWHGRGKYRESVAPDTTDLPSLPKGWAWASLDQLLELMRNGISAKPDGTSGLPILRISAVRALSVNLEDIRYLKADASEYPDYVLAAGDLLFTRYNGNPDLVGVCGVVPAHKLPFVHPDKLIRCRLVASGASPQIVAMMANVGASRDYLARRVRTTAGQAGISGGDLKGQPIPVPPLAEQMRIIAEVERRLSVIEELEAAITANLQRGARLRQSILQQAFSFEEFTDSK